MNAAKLSKSERLQRVCALLKKGGEYSTLDIINNANVCAVSAIVAELRQNGMNIECNRRGDIWYYRLVK